MGSYCNANTEVSAKTGMTYTTGTQPTLIEVNEEISEKESIINLMLKSIGITTVTDASLKGTLAYINSVGAAASILRRYPKEDKMTQIIGYQKEWEDWINKIVIDKSYQQLFIAAQGTASVGALTGSAQTEGYVNSTESSQYPYYGKEYIEDFHP